MIPLFDLHCDTLLEAYNKNEGLIDNSLHISLKKAACFSPYIQVTSIWSDFRLNDDEAYLKTISVIKHYRAQSLYFCTKTSDFREKTFIFGIEDARLLNNDISRLERLYSLGARVITLNWKGISCIGGAYDTDFGLSDFGKRVVARCAELGIIVDTSHSSPKATNEVIAMSKELNFIPIASHSNAFSVWNHPRNLSDEVFKEFISLKALVGISLVSEHLGNNADLKAVLRHIDHFLSLGGENIVSLGCDFDGTDSMPIGIKSIKELPALYYLLSYEFGIEIAKKIFFQNAYDFFRKNLN